MKLSSFGYVWAYGMTILNAGLFLVIEYPFLLSLRIYFAALAITDISLLLMIREPHIAYTYWYCQMALLVLQGFITADLVVLLCPKLPRTLKRIIPAVIVMASIVCGKPGTTWGVEYPSQHMLCYEIFCLAFLIIVISFSLILSSVPRYDGVVLGFGFLLAAQSVAAMHRLYVGISPFVWNACWLAGICFIVHAIFTYEPLGTFPQGKSSEAGRK